MKYKIVASSGFFIKTNGRVPFEGTFFGKVIPLDQSFRVDNDFAINNNLIILKQIIGLNEEIPLKTKLLINIMIEILKDYYNVIQSNDGPAVIDFEVSAVISALNKRYFDNNQPITTHFIDIAKFIITQLKLDQGINTETIVSLDSKKEIFLDCYRLEAQLFRGLMDINKQDILNSCNELSKYSNLLMLNTSDLEFIFKTETLKSDRTHFFLRTNIHVFDEAYFVHYFYNNPYFLGTISPIISNCHGVINHLDNNNVIIKLPDDYAIPEYIKAKTDEQNNVFLSDINPQDCQISPSKTKGSKGPISDVLYLKNGSREITLKITADQNGVLNAPNFFSAGLIRLENLHKMIISKHNEAGDFSSKHYKLLMDYLINLHKDRQGTLTFRLTEDNNKDKKISDKISRAEGRESLEYLLYTEAGNNILKMDIELILRLKSKGVDVELLIPNPKNLEEINQVKEVVRDVQLKLSKSGINTEKLKIGIMVENPLILSDIAKIQNEIQFLSLGINDMTNTYAYLRSNHPEIFDRKGIIDLTKLSEEMLILASDRRNINNKSPQETFLTSDFINFIKTLFFDKIIQKYSIRACGNIDKGIAVILVVLGAKAISLNQNELESIFFFLKSIDENRLYPLLKYIEQGSGFENSAEILAKILALVE